MGCGTSKAVAPTAAAFATKPVPEKPPPKALAEQEEDRPRDTASSPEAKPLVSNPSSHDAKMLLNDWSKPTEDRAHARIMSKSPAITAPSKSRGAGAADDAADSSEDEGCDNERHNVVRRVIPVHKDRNNNVVDHAMPGAVQEESLITMFRPKSAIRLDLD